MSERTLGLCAGQVAASMLAAAAAALGAPPVPAALTPPTRVLADWRAWPSPGAKASIATAAPGADGWLVVRTRTGAGRAGIVLQPEKGAWNLDAFAEIAVPVRNPGTGSVRVVMRLDDDRSAEIPTVQHRGGFVEALLPPGSGPHWLAVPLGDREPSPLAKEMISLAWPPADFVRRGTVDGARVTAVLLFVPNPQVETTLEVGPVVARGVPAPLRGMPREQAFPLVDESGQYRHRDWPGKIHSEADLAARLREEEADLAGHPRPAEWDRFGGWAAGSQREATGFFRVEKIDGRWWMVDPDGRLFWSHGVVRVGTRIRVGTVYHGSPTLDREYLFTLPPKGSPLGAFFGAEPESSRGYYVGKVDHPVYDHLEANLFRKYGSDWTPRYAEQTQRRLASWGLNSIANSSDPAVYGLRRTPYTAVVYSAPPGRFEHRIEASTGNWGKLPDPFDPGLRALIERTLRTDLKDVLNDPWCLGFFVDNELNWGDSCHVAEVVLASSARQPAKQAFVDGLKQQYGNVQALNAAWGTQHESWDALLAATTPPDRTRAHKDLEAFSERLIDAYFQCCRESIKAASPHHLYLGCRFAGGGNPLVMRTAARYCDVISINRYARGIADLALPEGLDRPILIGEFHFCALDRGPFAAGLVPVASQEERAQAYRAYVESALRNPAVIGTHWFQYYDQPTTGRFDGENYQTGLLDICDTPYAETIAACRDMGAGMYRLRAKGE